MVDAIQTEQVTTFDSSKEGLEKILGWIDDGKVQLPDFQRDWKWDDERVRSLLTSVSMSYPIGTLMLLETGNPDVRFRARPIIGAVDHGLEPERLILDGQQRLTALFQALKSGKPVQTRDDRKKPVLRWYYLNIDTALNPNGDRDEAILSVPEEKKAFDFQRKLLYDYSDRVKEIEADVLPLSIIFDTSALMDWQMEYVTYDEGAEQAERKERWKRLNDSIIKKLHQYQVPYILLHRPTPKDAVCQVFEKVNTGGVTLDVFELLTATFAADDFLLRDDWDERKKRLHQLKVLRGIGSSEFLQAITLLATWDRRRRSGGGNSDDRAPAISAKRKDVLKLSLKNYERWADQATEGFEAAARLLIEEKIFSERDLPYRTQVVPMAVVFTLLRQKGENAGVRAKIRRWYWAGVFGELYGSAVETRFARDVLEVLAWIDGGQEPSTIKEANFAPERLLTLRTRNSAAYKGLYALLMRDGGLDFRSGTPIDLQTYFEDSIDIHHIFPRAWCEKNGVGKEMMNSIVNKAAISARTNRKIGGRAPSAYLRTLQSDAEISEEDMDEILRSHAIDTDCLWEDDFGSFFARRADELLARIENATGKPVPRPEDGMPWGALAEEAIDYEGEEEATEDTDGSDGSTADE